MRTMWTQTQNPVIQYTLLSKGPCMQLNKGNTEVEEEPDVRHLDVGGGGEAVGDTNEEGGEGEHHSHVDCH